MATRMITTAATLSMVLLAGCQTSETRGDAGPSPATSPPASSPTVSPVPSEDLIRTAAAKRQLRRAVRDLWRQSLVGFRLELDFPGGAAAHRLDGGADTVARRWWIRAESSGSGSPKMRWSARSAGRLTWMQMDDWPEPQAGCWLEMSSGVVPLGFPGLSAGTPTYLTFLGNLRADGFRAREPDVIVAHTDAGSAMVLFTGQLAEAMGMGGLDRADVRDTQVTMIVHLIDGRLDSVSTSVGSVLDGWPEARDQLEDNLEAVLEEGTSTLSFPAPPPAPSPFEPPRGAVMQVSDEGC